MLTIDQSWLVITGWAVGTRLVYSTVAKAFQPVNVGYTINHHDLPLYLYIISEKGHQTQTFRVDQEQLLALLRKLKQYHKIGSFDCHCVVTF